MSTFGRRPLMLAALAAPFGARAQAADLPPVIFVHGNGDTAGLWITTLWRFESNGYPRDRLFALDLRYPQATSVSDKPPPGRSTADEVMRQLAAEVTRVKALTGAEKVVLVAQSRGGNTVRNYLKNGGGAAHVALLVTCGAVNHGVIVSDKVLIGSEFNGASPFMRDLNAREVLPGIRTVTIRPEQVRLVDASETGAISATVQSLVYFGTDTHCHLTLADGTPITARLQSPATGEAGHYRRKLHSGEQPDFPIL